MTAIEHSITNIICSRGNTSRLLQDLEQPVLFGHDSEGSQRPHLCTGGDRKVRSDFDYATGRREEVRTTTKIVMSL